MDEKALKEHLKALYPKEDEGCDWKEFKNLKNAMSSKKGEDVESYVSAISNMSGGHLVIGVRDRTMDIVGIQDFGDYTVDNIRPRLAGRCSHLNSEKLKVEPFTTDDTGKTVWVLHIPRHEPRLPVNAHGRPWQRLGDSLVPMRPERLAIILRESIDPVDWSAEVVATATIDDLDPDALLKAREKFKERHRNAPFHDEIDGWDSSTFLDRAKLTANGDLTRAALLLLGKEAAATHHLSPHPAQITWKLDADEKAYEHFGPPFLLSTTRVLEHIRNIKHKLFPNNQLLPVEVWKYDTRVILEALHNCVAHQDYSRRGRILVTETADRLIFENAGNFFEGVAEDYFAGRRTPTRYRNPWLAQAMVQLSMIDTMGYGIHSMTVAQRERFFPLPDYSNSTMNRVVVEIFGRTLDENYSMLLLERQELDIDTVILLDRIQKRLPIPDAAAQRLRRDGLIEGRKTNYHVSARVAATTETEATYTRNRGLDKNHLKQFVLTHLDRFSEATRAKLDSLLLPLVPAGLTDKQKRDKVKNLLTQMRTKDHSIVCDGRGPGATWRRTEPISEDEI